MKEIHFQIPDELYEALHKVLPARGEKTLFFTRIVELAVEQARERDTFAARILEALGREGGDEDE